jgi:hypothetical protein
MNNIVLRKVILTGVYQPLVPQPLIASVEISALPSNTGPAFFLGEDGGDIPWIPGEYHGFKRVNLAEMLVKGTPGDVLTVIGGTW